MVAGAARRMVDKAYALGDTSAGWDCLSMIWEFYDRMGVGLPREHKGVTAENYAKVWASGGGREEFLSYLEGLGESIGKNYLICGDMVVCEYEDWAAPGIYLGSGNMLCAYEKGVFVVPMRFFDDKFLFARRICPTS